METAGQSVSGTYTVGNVKAFTGLTDGGGTAGGWALVITYEDPNETTKFISSFEGYALLRSGGGSIEYDYDGFRTIPTGPVNARFGIAALEGDEGFVGDGLSIKGDLNPTFSPLGDAVNPQTNFFNASISRNGANVTTRNPASRNTLGFDLDLFQIDNPGNSVLQNGETGATFQTSTVGDTFATFLNTFAIEVIRPDIRIIKTVEDKDGRQIPQGNGVRLGDELFYKLTIENIGNDDAINTTIRDIIPNNTNRTATDFVDVPAGVTYTYDAANFEFTFDIDDSLVTTPGAPFIIRFKVKVAESCIALRDACSEEVNNRAEAEYTGRLSGIVVSADASVFDVDGCQKEEDFASNFIIDLGSCVFEEEKKLCNGAAELEAGRDFDSYEWKISAGIIIGTTRAITVTEPGVYTVNGISTDCRDNTISFNVTPYTSTNQNPLLIGADRRPRCTSGGTFRMPEYYLCGSTPKTFDISSFISADTIEWERLDEGSCSSTTPTTCPNTDSACTWTSIGSGNVFVLNDGSETVPVEGQYRIAVVFESVCVEFFYFNVYKNTLNATLESRDIICGEPGFVRVEGCLRRVMIFLLII